MTDDAIPLMTDDEVREALLELAQELDRMRALVETLARRVRELETRYEDDGKVMEVRTRRERYGAAASNGNLRQRVDRPTDADTIAAAGMAGVRGFFAFWGR